MKEDSKKVLDMALKEVFLEPIHNGTKRIEYRDMTPYWVDKLLDTESYGKPTEEIIDGIMHGDLELKPRGWTHIRFHQSNGSRVLLVELKDIKTYIGRHTFCLYLGNVIENKYGE